MNNNYNDVVYQPLISSFSKLEQDDENVEKRVI